MEHSIIPSLISIIIPVYNAERTLRQCLDGLFQSTDQNFEVILVDDASSDASPDIAQNYPIRFFQFPANQGANRARNHGAQQADGTILLFIDSDIVIQPDTLSRIRQRMTSLSINALVGVYSGEERNQGLITCYKNHWIRYSYIRYQGSIDWIFGSITAIRKDAFDRTDGFNTSLAARDGIDDIEFGKRLVKNGTRIELDPGLTVTHLKEFSLFGLLRNEFYRSMGFAGLAMALKQTGQSIGHGFANIYPEFIIGTLYSPVLGLAAITGLILKIPNPVWLFGLMGGYLVLNIRFLLYLFRERQYRLCVISPGLLWLDQIVCLIGGGWGTLTGLYRRFFTRILPN